MKYRAPLIATAIILAAASGVAGRDYPPTQAEIGEARTAQTLASKHTTARVHCFNGLKSDQRDLYRGWFCVPEAAPPSLN